MTIQMQNIEVFTVSTDVGTVCKQVQFFHQADWKHFQELVQRGANLWPDAPPSIKEFADKVTIGHVQQNYQEQNKDAGRLAYQFFHRCSCGYVTEVKSILGRTPDYPISCGNKLRRTYVASVDLAGNSIERDVLDPCNNVEMFNPTNKENGNVSHVQV